MADIQFQEPQYAQSPSSAGPSGITGLITRWGLAKDERQAKIVLLIIAVLAVVVAVFTTFSFGGAGAVKPLVPSIDGMYPPR